MARAKVVHSDDACTIVLRGNPQSPEPSTVIVKFPGGHVEIARTSDNRYWAHTEVNEASNIAGSRIDYDPETRERLGIGIPRIDGDSGIKHLAILIDGPFQDHGE